MAWRHDPVILARLPRIERLHLAGRPNTAIAVEMDISEATVRDDLKRLNELWLERTTAEQDQNRARVLAELEDVRVRAIEAAEWDLTCERAVLFGDPIGDDDGTPVKVYRDAKGSAQFRGQKAQSLNVARQAAMDKAKILGVEVSKVALTDSQGEDMPLDELVERFSRRRAKDAEPEGEAP